MSTTTLSRIFGASGSRSSVLAVIIAASDDDDSFPCTPYDSQAIAGVDLAISAARAGDVAVGSARAITFCRIASSAARFFCEVITPSTRGRWSYVQATCCTVVGDDCLASSLD